MTEKQAAINKAVRESILEALTNQGVNRVEAYAAALMGMYAVQADLNQTEFHLGGKADDTQLTEAVIALGEIAKGDLDAQGCYARARICVQTLGELPEAAWKHFESKNCHDCRANDLGYACPAHQGVL